MELRDTAPVVAEILDGEHDDVLRHIARAADLRLKIKAQQSGLRPMARIRVTDAALEQAADMVGRTGIIKRINPKTVTVKLDPLNEFDHRTGWRLPHSWLELA